MKANIKFQIIAAAIAALTVCSIAWADIPTTMTYQGRLTDANGYPVIGTYDIRFRIYNAESGGSMLWEETHAAVHVDVGLFSVMLGSINPISHSVFTSPNRWIGVKVGSENEMTPRIGLGSTPYAYCTGTVDGASGGSIAGDVDIGSSLTVDGNVSITDGRLLLNSGNGGTNVGIRQNYFGGANSLELTTADSADAQATRIIVRGNSNRPDVEFYTGSYGNEVSTMFIEGTDGNVGIGTTTPGSKLEVAGMIYSTSEGFKFPDGSVLTSASITVSPPLELEADGPDKVITGINSDNTGSLGGQEEAVYGQSSGGKVGLLGGLNEGVRGEHPNGNFGWLAGSHSGAHGAHNAGHWGSLGTGYCGAEGSNNSTFTVGLLGGLLAGVQGYGNIDYPAGYFEGDVDVVGNLTKSSGTFKIDHPLDPENKYLYHSFVESPDMMNVYNGNVVLDANGTATIVLPDYFESLNRDFRYQLTSIGAPGPNLYIAEEISGNRFGIAGGEPGSKVSWQVTGIRQDAYANAHRIQVEVDKPASEQGKYLHPVEHGAPETSGIYYDANQQVKGLHNNSEEATR